MLHIYIYIYVFVQWYFPMDFSGIFQQKSTCSAVVSKGLAFARWIFTGIVQGQGATAPEFVCYPLLACLTRLCMYTYIYIYIYI